MKKKLEWNVMNYEHSWSKGEVREPEAFNVFSTISFSKNFYELRKIEDRKEFEEKLERAVMYTYWGRCEYEMMTLPWPCPDQPADITNEAKKIDVYQQIKLNWDRFADYCWENRKNAVKIK